MKIDCSNIRKYEVFEIQDTDFVVEVTKKLFTDEDFVECWLYKKGYGIKMLMFGIKNDYNIHHIIENNLEEYIKIYEEEYGR